MSSQNLSTFNKNNIGDCSHLKVGIVCSKWNSDITDNLYDGAISTLIKLGVKKENITSFKVPGSFELIYGANKMSKKNVDVIICLGCVIRGETSHFDYICNSVSNGIMNLNIELDVRILDMSNNPVNFSSYCCTNDSFKIILITPNNNQLDRSH